MARGLESLEGQIGRDGPSDEVGDRGGEGVEEVEESDEGTNTNEGIRLGDLRALFEVDEDGVLGELE